MDAFRGIEDLSTGLELDKVENETCFISEENLLLDTQSVDSCLYILIPLNILILHPIFIN